MGIRRLQAAEKQRQALILRAAGATYQQIADQLGYAFPAAAHKAVLTGLRATLQEPADALRMLETQRLDRLWTAIWPQAVKGDLKSIDRALKLMERRAVLLGLDAVPSQRQPLTVQLVWGDTPPALLPRAEVLDVTDQASTNESRSQPDQVAMDWIPAQQSGR